MALLLLLSQFILSWLSMGLTPTFSTSAVCSRIFSRPASLNNDSFIHCMCGLLTFANISNGANLQLPLDTQKQKGIQL